MIFASYDESRPLYGLFDKLKEKNKLSFVQISGENNENCKSDINQLIVDEKEESVFLVFNFRKTRSYI